MNRRPYVLLAVLALSYLGMLVFMAANSGLEASEIRGGLLFGVLLVGVAAISVRKRALVGAPSSLQRGWAKFAVGSYGLAFATWMLGSVLFVAYGWVRWLRARAESMVPDRSCI